MHCDRCDEDSPYVHLTGHPLNGAIYWLCPDCLQAIILIWLVEHETGLQAKRALAAQGG